MDRLCRNNADGAECVRAVLSDDESIDDGTEFDGNYVESREGDQESAEEARSDNCSYEMDATDNRFHRKGQDEVR